MSSLSSPERTCASLAQPVVQTLRVYQTAKVVSIRDWRLGLLYYGLVFLIVLFVVGYEILYANDHFDKRDVSGTSLLNIQQPTKDACNPSHKDCESDFTPLVDLPYCDVYRGQSDVVPARNRRPCIYADDHTLVPTPAGGGSLFVPTRLDRRSEVRDCHPSDANNFTCRNEFRIVNQTGVQYVADIERYTLLLAHTYQRDTISGNNNILQGSYLECDRRNKKSEVVSAITRLLFGAEECPGGYWRRPIQCIIADCGRDPKSRRPQRSLLQRGARARGGARMAIARGRGLHGWLTVEEEALDADQPPPVDPHGVYAIPDGDVFSIARLLELGGVSLDNTTNLDGDPLREAGMVLDIQVQYNNLHHFASTFGGTQVEYLYKVAARPLHQVKEETAEFTSPDSSRRVIENRHGIEIVVKVEGTFGFFSIMNLLLMLTTASAMLAVATVLTDKLAIYAMSDRDFYADKKFEVADAHPEAEKPEDVAASASKA